jgi:hypothetical protein
MKVLTILEPWASLIVCGAKIETRSWATKYRGSIAIHAVILPHKYQHPKLLFADVLN